MTDLRYALRLARREPGYTAVAVLTMALGIGATTTLFSVAYGVLLKPLPWREPEQLMRVTETRKGQPARMKGTMSNGSYLAWRDAASTAIVGGYGLGAGPVTVVRAAGAEPMRLQVSRMTASMFDVLGARPALGRAFMPDDERDSPDAFTNPRVAILSYGLWQDWFGGRDEVIGAVIRVDDAPVVIVGVMPRGFVFPDRETAAWLPMPVGRVAGANGVRRIQIFAAMARLKADVTPQQGAAEATSRARTAPDPGFAAVAMFGNNAPPDIALTPAVEAMTADVRPAIVLLLAAVGLLLATAIANVGALQLARAAARRRELTVRAALGAGRRQLLRQLVAESALVGGMGAAAGVAVAFAAARVLPAVLPADFPRVGDIAVNLPVLLFAVVLAILASVACGLLPATEARRVDLAQALAEDSAASASGLRGSGAGRLRAIVMTAQVAVACVLLVGAALLVRSFVALMRADRGYDPTNLLTGRLDVPIRDDGPAHVAIADGVLTRLRGLPGVEYAAAANSLPFLSLGTALGTKMPSPTDPAVMVEVHANIRMVSPQYFQALRLRLIAGRLLSDSDAERSPAIVVNESFAHTYLGPSPLGRHLPIRFFNGNRDDWQVVGIVSDMHQADVTERPAPELFISYRQNPATWTRSPIIFVVRTADDPTAHIAALRSAVREQAPTAALDSIVTMDDRVTASLAKPRLYAVLLATFAIAALAIAAVGLFGLLSYAVAQRRREIGIRTALGAATRDIVRLVLRQALTIAATGVAVGCWTGFVLTRYLASFLYGLERFDALSYGAVGGVVAVATALACLVPARRAARVDPVEALRQA